MSTTAIGIDLGGTRIKAVVMNAAGNLLHECDEPTNDGNDQTWKNVVAKTVNDLRKKFAAGEMIIGISAPGLANETNSAIAFMPGRLQGLENFPWSQFLGIQT